MPNEEYADGAYQKAKAVAELAEVSLIIMGAVVFYLAPMAVVHGNAESWTTYVAGVLGLAFWAFALATFAGVL